MRRRPDRRIGSPRHRARRGAPASFRLSSAPLTARSPIAVLFDLDGTLVDTVPFILAAVRHTFEGYGSCPTDAEWIAGIGTPLKAQIASFARRPEDEQALHDRYRAYWLAHHDEGTRCFPGALEVVQELSRRGHPIGIVTAKSEQGAYRTLRHTGLLPFMQAVIGADSCANSKPHPEPVLLALSRLGGAPADAILIGDSPHDVTAAKAAGARAAAALWGACTREALAAAGADFFATDVREVPALVAAL
jgi:pyrophosphatase PpaX